MRLRIALFALVLTVLSAPPAVAGGAKLKLKDVDVSGQEVTVRGRVKLPNNTAARRKRTWVVLKLSDGVHRPQRHRAKIGSDRRFKASFLTDLTGELTLSLRVTIKGKKSGRRKRRTITIPAPAPGPGPLIGTFRLEPGDAPAGEPPSGSWFQMLTGNGNPLQNLSSPAQNNRYTPLTPGTDRGLRTDVYQAPPSPAFSGGNSGHSLAGRIIDPQRFFGYDFGIVTAARDPQLNLPDPLPEIRESGGRLSGQITAWVAQWNGQSFNQGSPKPNGTTPPPTTPLRGTYSTASRRYTLDWKSLIVGGPFNGFTGVWHLEGTFVPAD